MWSLQAWCALFGVTTFSFDDMSQRVAASNQGAEIQAGQARSYPEVNPLMPASLRRIPPWYEGGSFRHTGRFLVGAIPGATLLITVTGTT